MSDYSICRLQYVYYSLLIGTHLLMVSCLKKLYQVTSTEPIVVLPDRALTGYKATTYNLMILKAMEEVVVTSKSNSDTKQIGLHTRNA